MGMGVRSAVLKDVTTNQRSPKYPPKKKNNRPDNLLLTITQPQRAQIHILQKLSDGHEVDQTIALFPTNALIPESLRVQQMRDEVWRVGFDDGEDDKREKNVA
jgi:hypothetical protein